MQASRDLAALPVLQGMHGHMMSSCSPDQMYLQEHIEHCVDRLVFHTFDDYSLADQTGKTEGLLTSLNKFCTVCRSGSYMTKVPQQLSRQSLICSPGQHDILLPRANACLTG